MNIAAGVAAIETNSAHLIEPTRTEYLGIFVWWSCPTKENLSSKLVRAFVVVGMQY